MSNPDNVKDEKKKKPSRRRTSRQTMKAHQKDVSSKKDQTTSPLLKQAKKHSEKYEENETMPESKYKSVRKSQR